MGGFIKTFIIEGNTFCALCYYHLPEEVREKAKKEEVK